MQDNLLENIQNENLDNVPIVLIDISGSTSAKMKSKQNVLTTEGYHITRILSNKNIESCNLILWCSEAVVFSTTINITDIKDHLQKPRGDTQLLAALDAIPDNWLNRYRDIYIVTDGVINDDKHKITQKINWLANKDVSIYIITVENNNFDYNTDDCEAGDRIYKIFRKNKLMNYVRSFTSFNNIFIDEPFTSLSNPIVNEGMIPFRGKVFAINRLNEFITYINDIIKTITDDDKFQKLLHDLSITLYHLGKSKPDKIKNDIVDIFAKLSFTPYMTYWEVKDNLMTEIQNHNEGMSTTFQDYKKNRTKLFERAQESLEKDVVNNISNMHQTEYITLPIPLSESTSVIYRCHPKTITEIIKLGPYSYNHAGVSISEHTIPVFPRDTPKNEFMYQCIRQWIRALYSRLYKKIASDDIILYLFLVNALKINLSNASDDIKNMYKTLAFIMLDRKRFASNGIKEIEHLEAGNPPLPILESFSECDNMAIMLDECKKLTNFCNIKPYTLWYAIVLMLNNITLIKNQLQYCIKDIRSDFLTLDNPKMLLSEISKIFHLNIIEKIHTITLENYINELEYYCYVTTDDTTKTGGYKLPKHVLSNKSSIVCDPRYVITQEAYVMIAKMSTNNKMRCPICYTDLLISEFESILPKSAYTSNNTEITDIDIIDKRIFSNEMHSVAHVTASWFSLSPKETHNIYKPNNNKLYKLDELDFDIMSYEFSDPDVVIRSKMNQYLVTIKSSEEFRERIKQKFNFIFELDMTNICIAGGFCKSILLNQQVNDIDFFFYDLDNSKIISRLAEFVRDIIILLLKNIGDHVFFMLAYKENNNVFEILCLEDLTKSKDISETYIRNNSKNFKIHQKIQVILAQNGSMCDILNNFDIAASCVAFDKHHVYFTENSYNAYKYMINIIDENKYSNMYDTRLNKYFNSGFSLLLPELDIEKVKKISKNNNPMFEINNNCCFVINNIRDNIITVDSFKLVTNKHDDNTGAYYESVIVTNESNNVLERVFKYIDRINKKQTLVPADCLLTDDDSYDFDNISSGTIYYKFININSHIDENILENYSNGKPDIKIVEKLDNIIRNHDWYGNMRINVPYDEKQNENNEVNDILNF